MEMEQEDAKSGAPGWMVTFADLMSLLLTFFVLMLSFSTTEVMKFREAMGSIQEALGLMSAQESSMVPSGQSPLKEDMNELGSAGVSPDEMEQQLKDVLEALGLEDQGEARKTLFGVVLQLKGDLMFQSGMSDLSPKAYPVLDALATYINDVDRHVDIAGHTDSIPISTAIFPSNWELSAARAGQAVRYLVEHGVPPEKLRAIGQADTVPIADNATMEGRAKNRRVEFVFSPESKNLPTKSVEELTASVPTDAVTP
jgi:chemotaxis protein MotB